MVRRILLAAILVTVAGCATVEPPPLYISHDHGIGLSAAAYSPDGQLAAVANSSKIWILDTKLMKQVMTFSGNYRFGTNNTLVFIGNDLISSTGMTGAAGDQSSHAAIRIWNINDQFSEPIVIALPELGRYPISLDRSDSTGALAVGGENGSVVLLEPDGGGGFAKRQLPGLEGPVLDVVFSRDGSMVAAGGVHPAVVIWDTQSLEEVGGLPVEGNIYDLDLIVDQRSLLVVGDDLRLWKFMTEEEWESIKNPSMAGDYISIGAAVATLTVLTALAGSLGGSSPGMPMGGGLPEPEYGFCTRVADVSPGGDILVDVHSGLTKEKIRIIEIESGKVITTINPRGGRTCGATFSPDGTKLLIANNRVARLYDTKNWEHVDFSLK